MHEARFVCNVPSGALDGARYRPSLYGHGLLGRAEQVNDDKLYALHDDGLMFCATDWIGMANGDIPNAVGILQELSGFPSLADRLQQGFLGFLYLGRALIHPEGFSSHPAFRAGGGRSSIGDGCSTTAAARVASSALGSPQLRPTSPGRRSVYRG